MNKKRILFLIPNLCQGGTNRVLENILSLIDREKYDINILSIRGPHNKDPYYDVFMSLGQIYLLSDFIPFYIDILINGAFSIRLHSWMRKYLKSVLLLDFLYYKVCPYLETKLKPDLVVAFEESSVSILGSKFLCEKIAWVHCDYKFYVKSYKPVVGYMNKCYSNYNHIVCVSKSTANSFKMILSELSEKVQFIYNPLDLDRISTLSLEKLEDARFCNDVFTILSVGRFVEVKQFHLIPDIIKKMTVLLKNGKFKWYILGDGDLELIKETKDKIKEYGISNELFLLGNCSNPYPYMRASDLYVCTSYTEAFPCVISEAKALSIPVVSNNFASSKEILDKSSGIITDFDLIPQTIVELIENKDNRFTNLKNTLQIKDNSETIKEIESLFSSTLKT